MAKWICRIAEYTGYYFRFNGLNQILPLYARERRIYAICNVSNDRIDEKYLPTADSQVKHIFRTKQKSPKLEKKLQRTQRWRE